MDKNVKLDQFYTNDSVALKYYNVLLQHVCIQDFDIILEPSAGRGSFFKLFPIEKRKGIDLDPKFDGIEQCDFFNFNVNPDKKYIVIGNPPFGRVSSLAIKFFNHAAEFADIIAFIIPRTFKRVSVQNKLNLHFNLIFNEDLPLKPCCFSPPMNAKCCFQIWKKVVIPRIPIKYQKTHKDFQFIHYGPLNENKQPTPPQNSDFAILAFGGNCGKLITENLEQLSPKSYHFIKANIDINLLKERFNQLDYSISKDTCRQNSLGKQELIFLYEQKFE